MQKESIDSTMKKNPFLKSPFPELKEVSNNIPKEEIRQEIEQLREAIEFHNYRYYIKNDPVISDSKYDELFARLVKLEKKFPEFQSDVSPTRKVGAPPVEKLKKREHVAEMLSLNSSDKEKDVRGFVDFVRKEIKDTETLFFLEPKLDGLSVEVVYREGLFDYAATRGDGQTGEDISENIKTIRRVPLRLKTESKFPDFLSVRGEVYMDKEGFQRINRERLEKGQEPFANARNAAAGLIRQLDPGKVAGKPLDIFFYEIIGNSNTDFASHDDMLKHFEEWGLKINHESRKCDDIEDISGFYGYLGKKRNELPYEIDGIVIKLDNRNYRNKLGTRQRSPRWAFAWKFEPRKEITTLREIIIQVGRTGILTPVALLDPVEVGGVTVSRATEAIQASKKPGLSRFLYALGIRHAGIHIARVLAQKYGSLDKIMDASYDELEAIEEIGPEIARSIFNFFRNKDNFRMIQKLRETGVHTSSDLSSKKGNLAGKNLVLTGELEEFTRNEAEEKIESLGGRTTSSVSGNTDYLVVGKDPGGKLDEAKKRNVKTLDENQFRKMIADD
jgi:NAD-dependent DNA ligase